MNQFATHLTISTAAESQLDHVLLHQLVVAASLNPLSVQGGAVRGPRVHHVGPVAFSGKSVRPLKSRRTELQDSVLLQAGWMVDGDVSYPPISPILFNFQGFRNISRIDYCS